MRRSILTKTLATGVTCALLTILLPSAPAQAIPGMTAEYTKSSDWGSGYEARFAIHNDSGGTVTWQLEFDLPPGAGISSYWDATVTKTGDHVVATGAGWNNQIGNGGTVSFGWIGNPGGNVTPTNCTINGTPCGGGGPGEDTTPPSDVSGLNSPGHGVNTVDLSWNAATDNVGVAGYHIYRNGATSPTHSTTGTSTTFTDTGLSADTTYTYRVKAYDAAGNVSVNYSNSISVTTEPDDEEDNDPPSIPQNLHSTGKTATTISLAWNASTDTGSGVAGYEVFRNGGGTPIATVTGTSYTDTGLSPSTTYTYRVRAFDNAENRSALSSQISVTTEAGGGGGDFKKIAYFTQWGIYGRNFKVKDLDTTGMAAKLTHIHYAFANINQQGQCFEANQLGQGDAWADYQKRFSAGESVDGVGDVYNQELAGNFNQLLELKAKHPHLKVVLSLGGWTWSKYFSNAVLPQNRQAFVDSCVDMFIKGDLPVFGGEPQGGPGSGFGVFDGIDIDWEWPGAEGNDGNVIRPEDKANLTATMQLLRSTLDNYGASVGRSYSLSAFLPADVEKLDAGWDVPALFNYFDYATVQGYDFYGAWESTTNHQSQLYSPAANPHPRKYSVDIAVQALISRGAPASALSIGIPAYGRGWTNVAAGGNNGLYQTGSAASGTWEAGIEDYKVLKNRAGTVYRDTANGAMWKYDGTTFWSYDDPQLIAQKAQYVKNLGLGGMMMWSTDGDDGTLVSAMDSGLS